MLPKQDGFKVPEMSVTLNCERHAISTCIQPPEVSMLPKEDGSKVPETSLSFSPITHFFTTPQ